MRDTPTVPDHAQYLTFLLADEEYAIGILRVREIIEYDTLTRLPSAPRDVRGVINLRGSVVPVVDLSVRFGLPERAPTRRTCIIIVEVAVQGEDVVMGIMADAVSQVVDLRAEDIEPPPPFGTRARMEHIAGMGRSGSRFVVILDIDAILARDLAGELGLVEALATGGVGGRAEVPEPAGA